MSDQENNSSWSKLLMFLVKGFVILLAIVVIGFGLLFGVCALSMRH